MVTVPVTVNVPKETKEVIDFLGAIADKVLAKAPISEYGTLVDELYKALEGVNLVSDEVKQGDKGAMLAYLVATIGQKF